MQISSYLIDLICTVKHKYQNTKNNCLNESKQLGRFYGDICLKMYGILQYVSLNVFFTHMHQASPTYSHLYSEESSRAVCSYII